MLNNNLNLMPLNFNIITQGTSGLGVLLANAQSNGVVILENKSDAKPKHFSHRSKRNNRDKL